MQSVPQSDDKIKLRSQIHGIMIEAQDGDIIGRKNGAFTAVFSRFNYVSGTHCKVVKTAAGWHIQDLGSTNGTFYNGMTLVPNTLYPLANGTTIKIADIDLLITYNETGGGTVRI
jgi:pSer/pThr/pTyr-binding forkhead associated (FHA) protein